MSDFFDEEEDERNFFQRNRALTAVLAVSLVGGIVWGALQLGKGDDAPRRAPTVTMVKLAPLPPPPPPPPPPPQTAPPPEQKMIDQEPVNEPEEKPTPDEPPPAPDLGTGLKGNGPPDGFGLSGRGGNGTGLGGRNNGQRSKWGWYAGQVQTKLQDAMRNNRNTRNANLRVEVRIWADQTGRVTRSQLAGTSGDSAVDAALRSEVLSGLQLQEPPPAGMPMPIVLRVTARRPN